MKKREAHPLRVWQRVLLLLLAGLGLTAVCAVGESMQQAYLRFGPEVFYSGNYFKSRSFVDNFRTEIESILSGDIGSEYWPSTIGGDLLRYRLVVTEKEGEPVTEDRAFTNMEEGATFGQDSALYYSYFSKYGEVTSSIEGLRSWAPRYSIYLDGETYSDYSLYVEYQSFALPAFYSLERQEYGNFRTLFLGQYVWVLAVGAVVMLGSLVLLFRGAIRGGVGGLFRYLDIETLVFGVVICLVRFFFASEDGRWLRFFLSALPCVWLAARWLSAAVRRELPEQLFFLRRLSGPGRIWRTALCGVLLICFNLLGALWWSWSPWALLALALIDLAVLLWALVQRRELSRLEGDAARMARGEIDGELGRYGRLLRPLAEDLGRLQEGLRTAVDEQVKSERMKSDLITNVSHDLKTPLTSIINYVDLLKKELRDGGAQGESERYLDILERKSQRLKALTEDVVQLSKLASGNERCVLERRDLSELVRQVEGEFSERFERRELALRVELPEKPVPVDFDGDKLWRVLANLCENIEKYAMPKTRVYLKLVVREEKAILTLMNISATPLDLPAEQLLERFARGDHARTSEGSGLGLSIAKMLTELQGGAFVLRIEGDLFWTELTFPLAEQRF